MAKQRKRDKMCATCVYRNGATAFVEDHPCHEEYLPGATIDGNHPVKCFGSKNGKSFDYGRARYAEEWAALPAEVVRDIGRSVGSNQKRKGIVK